MRTQPGKHLAATIVRFVGFKFGYQIINLSKQKGHKAGDLNHRPTAPDLPPQAGQEEQEFSNLQPHVLIVVSENVTRRQLEVPLAWEPT